MSTSLPQLPAVFRNLGGKIHREVESAMKLLFYGLKDNKDAIITLKQQHDALAKTVTGVSATATQASSQASLAASQLGQPIPAGQTNIQNGTVNNPYVTSQRDHLGNVTLQGTGANITLNSNVTAPFTTRVINQSSSNSTLTPDNAVSTVNGNPTYTVNAGAAAFLYFDGLNWIAA